MRRELFPTSKQALRQLLKHYDRKADIEVVKATITPRAAEVILETCYLDDAEVGFQRKITASTVKRYARDMRNQNWCHSVQKLDFLRPGDGGYLANGYHTLSAIIEADVAIVVLVQFNTPRRALTKIDQNKPRSPIDSMAAAGYRFASAYSGVALARMVEMHLRGRFPIGKNPLPVDDLLEVMTETIGVESLASTHKALTGLSKLKRTSKVFSFCHWYFSTVDPTDATDADAFFESLGSGAGLDTDDPIYLLRDRILCWPGGLSSKQHDQAALLLLVVDAWNKWRSDWHGARLQLPKGFAEMKVRNMKLPALVRL